MIGPQFFKWLKKEKKINKIKTKVTNLSNLEKWIIGKDEIFHTSKRFFKIIGVRVNSNFFKKNWDQPMIVQKEIGILGIIKNPKNNKYLLQAKVEPGNKNKLQLSPSVQATKSNFQGIHGGKKVPYLKYFLNNKRANFINQSEQGFRYLYKYNSNILINVKKKINLKHNFFWLSLEELVELIKKKNILNMDTLSVFSSHIKKEIIDEPLNSPKKIKLWFLKNDNKYYLKIKFISLSKLKNWSYNKKDIVHKEKKHFSIIGVNIKTNKREVNEWNQPIIKGKNMAFAGYIIKNFKNTNHYLCRYILKPGLRDSGLTCTINTSDIKNFTKNNLMLFQQKMLTKFFFNKKFCYNKIFDNILSDEGGRFYHCQIRYMAMLLPEKLNFRTPSNYIWISQNQMVDIIKKKKLDIEARLLFGAINIKKIF
jgi:oxidase EvaA